MNKIDRIQELKGQARMLDAYPDAVHPELNSINSLLDMMKDYNIDDQSIVVEVGCFAGISTETFALCCEHVYAIDPWTIGCEKEDPDQTGEAEEARCRVDRWFKPESSIEYVRKNAENVNLNGLTWRENLVRAEEIFDKRMLAYNNVTKIKDFSGNAVSKVKDDSVDLVYLDGRHNYPGIRADILNYYPKLKVGGVLAGHDYKCRGIRRCVLHLMSSGFMTKRKKYSDGSWSLLKENHNKIEIPMDLKLTM